MSDIITFFDQLEMVFYRRTIYNSFPSSQDIETWQSQSQTIGRTRNIHQVYDDLIVQIRDKTVLQGQRMERFLS